MTEAEVIDWIREHTPLELLCERGGWSDDVHLKVEIRSKSQEHWIVDIESSESTMEISECDVTKSPRCGEFRVTFDTFGKPIGMQMIERLWMAGDTML